MWIERGRRPAVISVGAALGLAVFTGVRFVVLVATLSPAAYGRFNLYSLLITLLPLVITVGMTLQYQRVSHRLGFSAVATLLKWASVVSVLAIPLSAAITYIFLIPISGTGDLVVNCAAITLIALSASVSTFASQIALGLNLRALASILLFALNSAPTLSLLPASATGITESTLLIWWAVFSVIVAAASVYVVSRLQSREKAHLSFFSVLSLREGIASIPAQCGIWGFVFALRYLIGVNLGEDAVADFAIAATVFDTAFLISVSLLNYFTNRVMTGTQSPWRGLKYAIPVYIVVSILGALAVAWILPAIGQDGYAFDPYLGALISLGGLMRLYITAWRPRAIGLKRTHVTSAAFICVTVAATLLFVVWTSAPLVLYAFMTVAGFLVVGIVQRLAIGRKQSNARAV
ncbi:MAG: hypothetical protein C0482_10450 [Gordonia sp.]|nr:hypothetical protein [Gordonia sp. (in: high G+C Gram-positive bacteria)]